MNCMKNIKDFSAIEVKYDISEQEPDTLPTNTPTSRHGVDTERSLVGGIHENVRSLAACSFVLIVLAASANTITKGSADEPSRRDKEEAAVQRQKEEAEQRRAAERRVREVKAERESARLAKRPPID